MIAMAVALAMAPMQAARPLVVVAGPESSPDCFGMVTVKELDFAGAHLALVHECGMVNRESQLQVTIGDTAFVTGMTSIAYSGANMTAAPWVANLLDESIGHGTLADGTAALVRRVIIESYNSCRCSQAGCCDGVDLAIHHRSFVQVCRIDAAATAVACAQVQGLCRNDRCTPVSLVKGKLVVEGETYEVQP